MKNKFKRIIALFLILIMLSYNIIFPVVSYAQVEPTPTDTPAEAPVDSQPVTNTDTSTIDVNPTPPATEEAPVVDTSITPTPTVTIDPNIINSTIATDSATVNADTGNNSIIATPSASNTQNSNSSQNNSNPQNSASVSTGDSVGIVTQNNTINTTSVNAEVISQTINIFVAQNGSINLTDPFTIASNAVNSYPSDPVINISVVSVDNYTYLTNNIAVNANTGGNSVVTGNQDALINTGNAYSVVSLVNQVNFTVVNSKIHIITINLFGSLNGNIILPNMDFLTNCASCAATLTANNDASVTNNISSLADSGNNNATASAATITTGDAVSNVNNVNLVNTNLYGSSVQALFINTFGLWTGNFIGWDTFAPTSGGGNLMFYSLSPPGTLGSDCSSCSANLNASSSANVTNNISSAANTGGNSINTNSNGTISTGNAFSFISLINFINSNFINSYGFFAFLNIFGNWTGNIGGEKEFAALNKENTVIEQDLSRKASAVSENTSQFKQTGGQLQVQISNNVGEYVNPGDTVTFFVKINNPGSGKVYGTKLLIYLEKDKKIMGGTAFEIGELEGKSGKKLTTGFVLSKNAPGGTYFANAFAQGTVGPNDAKIEAMSQSTFDIYGNFASLTEGNPKEVKQVLGSHFPPANSMPLKKSSADIALYLLLVILSFVGLRAIKQRKILKDIFIKNISVKEKMIYLRMFFF